MVKHEDVLVRLPAEQARALRDAVAEGDYANESELLAEAFAEWQAYHILDNLTEAQKAVFRRKWDEGLASGPSIPFDAEEIKRKAREGLVSRIKRG